MMSYVNFALYTCVMVSLGICLAYGAIVILFRGTRY